MFCYTVSNWKWMKEAFNDWMIWCFIKVGNWWSGEQCGSWSWQQFVSRQNQNVTDIIKMTIVRLLIFTEKKDTDNKNKIFCWRFFICYSKVQSINKCIYMYIKTYLAIKLVNTQVTCSSLWFWQLVSRDKEAMHLALNTISYKCTAK